MGGSLAQASSGEAVGAEPIGEPLAESPGGEPAEVMMEPAAAAAVPAAPEPVAAASAEPLPEPEANAPEPSSEPAIKPIVIGGADEPPAEKKRGWWRR